MPSAHDRGRACLIPLRNRAGDVRAYAIVDPQDFDWLSEWSWSLTDRGYVKRSERTDDGRTIVFRMHREIMGLDHGDLTTEVDHKNRNRLDNRRSNLRISTRLQNCCNRGSDGRSRSGFRNVYWVEKMGKWRAKPRFRGRDHHLGYFLDLGDAAEAVRSFWSSVGHPILEGSVDG